MLALYLCAGFLCVWVLVWVVSLFNSLVQVQNNIEKAWGNIDVLLRQRNEELPKLIQSCSAFMQHERDVLRSLAALRQAYERTDGVLAKTRLENQLQERLSQLATAAEGYPAARADELYQNTLTRIRQLESAIADRRAFFNDTVEIYNIQRETFPQVLFARLLGFRRHPLLALARAGGT